MLRDTKRPDGIYVVAGPKLDAAQELPPWAASNKLAASATPNRRQYRVCLRLREGSECSRDLLAGPLCVVLIVVEDVDDVVVRGADIERVECPDIERVLPVLSPTKTAEGAAAGVQRQSQRA